MRALWQFIRSRPVISGVIIGFLGFALALEGSWLIWVGGTWFYVFEGVFYMVIGGLLIAGRRLALWLNLAILLATGIWAFLEVGLRKYAVFALLPRLDLAMIISIWLAMPWVWRRLGPVRAHHATAEPGKTPVSRAAFAGSMIPLAVTVALLLTGIVNIIQLPQMPASSAKQAAATKHAASQFNIPTFGIKPGNWRYYGRTVGGSRYSPLDQITKRNVADLKKVWSYQNGDMKHSGSGPPFFNDEAVPTVVDNIVYSCSPNAWVFALNAVTGKQIWKYKQTRVNNDDNNEDTCRGVAYYQAPPSYDGPCKTRIIAPTQGPYIVALDAKTGKECKQFGDNGMIDLKQHMGRVMSGALVQTSEPLVMDGLIYTGGNIQDNWYLGEPSGVVRAWDAISGKLIWAWDLGSNSPNAKLSGNQIYTPYTPNAWGTITGDPRLGIIYVPLGNATPDYYPKFRRPFDNEYGGAVVALNAKTGHELWHFKQVNRGAFDYDLPIGPSLVDWPNGHGGTIPALVQTSKRGLLFALNRKTGKPLFPIKQEKIGGGPPGGVLTKWASKTQPIQPKMPSFAPKRLKEVNMWGLTPFDQMWCRVAFNQLYYNGPATVPTVQGSLMYPTFDGVIDYYGAAFDPRGKMVAAISRLPFVGRLIPRDQAAGKGDIKEWNGQGNPPMFKGTGPFRPQYGLSYAIDMAPFLSPIRAPCDEPPWGALAEVDLASRKIEWKTPLGDSRHTAPFHISQNLPLPTGIFTLGAGVITKSGIIFVAGTPDNFIRAFDEDTGRLLWQHGLPYPAISTPAIYRGKDGREYIVITSGGHEVMGTLLGDYTVAFALPKKDLKNE